jgi:hypothetical protein
MTQTEYNANNQLTTWGTANLFYDVNGNMTSDGTHSYSRVFIKPDRRAHPRACW